MKKFSPWSPVWVWWRVWCSSVIPSAPAGMPRCWSPSLTSSRRRSPLWWSAVQAVWGSRCSGLYHHKSGPPYPERWVPLSGRSWSWWHWANAWPAFLHREATRRPETAPRLWELHGKSADGGIRDPGSSRSSGCRRPRRRSTHHACEWRLRSYRSNLGRSEPSRF